MKQGPYSWKKSKSLPKGKIENSRLFELETILSTIKRWQKVYVTVTWTVCQEQSDVSGWQELLCQSGVYLFLVSWHEGYLLHGGCYRHKRQTKGDSHRYFISGVRDESTHVRRYSNHCDPRQQVCHRWDWQHPNCLHLHCQPWKSLSPWRRVLGVVAILCRIPDTAAMSWCPVRTRPCSLFLENRKSDQPRSREGRLPVRCKELSLPRASAW